MDILCCVFCGWFIQYRNAARRARYLRASDVVDIYIRCGFQFREIGGPFGNIDKSGSSSFVATYDSATNHLTKVGSLVPTYDTNGNLTFDAATSTTHKYTWDADGNMLSADGTTVTLTYDALDRMMEQARGTAHTEIVYSPTGGKLGLMNGQTMSKAYVPLLAGVEAVYVSGVVESLPASGLAGQRTGRFGHGPGMDVRH